MYPNSMCEIYRPISADLYQHVLLQSGQICLTFEVEGKRMKKFFKMLNLIFLKNKELSVICRLLI